MAGKPGEGTAPASTMLMITPMESHITQIEVSQRACVELNYFTSLVSSPWDCHWRENYAFFLQDIGFFCNSMLAFTRIH